MAERLLRVVLAAATAIAIAIVLAPASALAQPPPNEHDTAFKSGLAEYERGNYVAAITTWENLLSTIGEERGYKALYNLGLAYAAIGDVTHAIERFRAFERRVAERAAGPDAASVDDTLRARADDARKRATELEATHGAVSVHAPTRGGLVLTRVGTADPRAAGYVVWLAPGTHSVEIFVGTPQAKTIAVEVVAGRTVDVDTTPPAAPAPPPLPIPDAPAVDDARPRPFPWIWAGATVVSLAAPLTMYLVAKGKEDDANALGAGNTGYASAKSTYDTTRIVYDASFAVPGILAVVTAAIWLWPSPSPSRAHPQAAVAVGPSSVLVRGTF